MTKQDFYERVARPSNVEECTSYQIHKFLPDGSGEPVQGYYGMVCYSWTEVLKLYEELVGLRPVEEVYYIERQYYKETICYTNILPINKAKP